MLKKISQTTKAKLVLKRLRGSSEEERLLHRLHAVVLVLDGFSASETARLFGDSPRAVSYWVTRFSKLGIDGLRSEPRSGRPRSLSAGQQKLLRTFIQKQERESKPFNAGIVSQFIKRKFGVDLTVRHCWRILKLLKA